MRLKMEPPLLGVLKDKDGGERPVYGCPRDHTKLCKRESRWFCKRCHYSVKRGSLLPRKEARRLLKEEDMGNKLRAHPDVRRRWEEWAAKAPSVIVNKVREAKNK